MLTIASARAIMRAMSFPAPLPHGPITRVVDRVFLVRGSFQMGPLMRIGRTMTVLQHDDGLVVLNAVRLSSEGEEALDRLGKVKHLVKLSDSHGLDEPYYVHRYAPTIWASAGAKLTRISATHELGPASPIRDALVVDFPGATGWREAALWVPHGEGTLIACDALQNHVDAEGTSALARVMTPLMGFKGGVIVAPMWRRFQKVQGPAVERAFGQAMARRFANLITGHGPAVIGGAHELVRSAIARATV
jgi:hypothetical protein